MSRGEFELVISDIIIDISSFNNVKKMTFGRNWQMSEIINWDKLIFGINWYLGEIDN